MASWPNWVREALVALHREDSAQDMIEYALLGALIALGAVAGMTVIASTVNQAFSVIGNRISSSVS